MYCVTVVCTVMHYRENFLYVAKVVVRTKNAWTHFNVCCCRSRMIENPCFAWPMILSSSVVNKDGPWALQMARTAEVEFKLWLLFNIRKMFECFVCRTNVACTFTQLFWASVTVAWHSWPSWQLCVQSRLMPNKVVFTTRVRRFYPVDLWCYYLLLLSMAVNKS